MSDAKWALMRGNREPMIWPFRTQEDAEDWALEHGCLDWHTKEIADRPEHEAICGRCREPWPCEHVRLDRHAVSIIRANENRCARCGKQIGWMKITIKSAGDFGEDVRYHGRQGACKNEALRRLRALDTDGARAELERIAKQDAYNRRLRELDKARRLTSA